MKKSSRPVRNISDLPMQLRGPAEWQESIRMSAGRLIR